jgi:hypothetical protein
MKSKTFQASNISDLDLALNTFLSTGRTILFTSGLLLSGGNYYLNIIYTD